MGLARWGDGTARARRRARPPALIPVLVLAIVAPMAGGVAGSDRASAATPRPSPAPAPPTPTPTPEPPAPFSIRVQRPPPEPGDAWAGDRPPVPDRPFRSRAFDLPDEVAWDLLYPADRWHGSIEPDPPLDADGIPVRIWVDGRPYVSPTNLGIQALRRLHAYIETGDPRYRAVARLLADRLRELGVRDGRALWLPFPYDDRRALMRAPWVNALSQALALSLFSRLHRLDGDPRDLATAVGLFESLRQQRRPDGPWVASLDRDGYLWFEHYPGGLRGRVLNAHAYTVVALADYWRETRSPEARRLLEAGLTTLKDRGAAFRREGTWSLYNLRNPVAHANYHPFHVRQFRALTPISGDPWFAAMADLLSADFDWRANRHLWRDPTPSRSPDRAPGASPDPSPEAPSAPPAR